LTFCQESYDLCNRHFASRDPHLAPFQRNPRAGVIDGDELLPRKQFKKTEFFNDLLDRFDLHYSTLLPFAPATGQAESILTLWRGEQQGHMPREYEALLAALIPHLKSAVGIKPALVAAGERALRAEAALDTTEGQRDLLSASHRCQWRLLPRKFPAWGTMYHYFRMSWHPKYYISRSAKHRNRFSGIASLRCRTGRVLLRLDGPDEPGVA
jgi:hypothetical protein